MKLKVAIVGAGEQSTKEHIPVIQESPESEVVCVCDTHAQRAAEMATQLQVPAYLTLEDMLSKQHFDAAVVAVPHSDYAEIIQPLLARRIHILKEKPLASSLPEATQFATWSKFYDTLLMVSTQRRFDPAYRFARSLIPELGDIYHVQGQYLKNIERLDVGWRAKFITAKGGALLDMGYHFIDQLIWFLGLPKAVIARKQIGNRKGQDYDVEDTMQMSLTYDTPRDPNNTFLAHVTVSRVAPYSSDQLVIFGSRGSLMFDYEKIVLFEPNGTVRVEIAKSKSWQQALKNQWRAFCAAVREPSGESTNFAVEHLEHLALIDSLYFSANNHTSDLINLKTGTGEGGLNYAA